MRHTFPMLKPPDGVKPGIIGPHALRAERSNWLVMLLGVPGVIVVVMLLLWFKSSWLPTALPASANSVVLLATTLALLSIPFVFAKLLLKRGHARDLADLDARDFRSCTQCRYDLTRHGESGECPECGTAFTSKLLRRSWRWTYHEAKPVRIPDSALGQAKRTQSTVK